MLETFGERARPGLPRELRATVVRRIGGQKMKALPPSRCSLLFGGRLQVAYLEIRCQFKSRCSRGRDSPNARLPRFRLSCEFVTREPGGKTCHVAPESSTGLFIRRGRLRPVIVGMYLEMHVSTCNKSLQVH
jgi:hypothetical protein